MLNFLLRRSLAAIAMLLVVGTIIFSLLVIVPGDPAELLLTTGGGSTTQEAVEALRVQMGLDKPVLVQYFNFLSDTIRFDFGSSIIDGADIATAIGLRLPRTLELIIAAAVIALGLGIPAGTMAALRAGGAFDKLASALMALLTSVPVFVVGTLLIYLFAQVLRIMPAGGYVALQDDPVAHFRAFVLPAVCVSFSLLAIVIRMNSASDLEMRSHDWVRTATAKGLRRNLVVRRPILRNALGPVITVVGLQLGILLGSTVLVEFVYNWPGLSGLLVTAVEQRDYPTVRAVILTVAAIFILINLVIDILYSLLDPRIRL